MFATHLSRRRIPASGQQPKSLVGANFELMKTAEANAIVSVLTS